ncbi:hypothetical protein BaRGS_00022181 [Batillaria attramentaria]|uniref:Uncharacterized protein n=1 Tax=Batillaria attramentaria TaxID=370345 RepID=A0ABD0KHP7_9CAEN
MTAATPSAGQIQGKTTRRYKNKWRVKRPLQYSGYSPRPNTGRKFHFKFLKRPYMHIHAGKLAGVGDRFLHLISAGLPPPLSR